MPVATYNGVSLHVQTLGAEGSPVVLLHGLLVGNLASFYFTAAPALARTHRVLTYDLRGHGKSERAASGYDVATMAKDLEAIADDFAPAPEPVTLVGHSYGAVIALAYALRHPARVKKLVVVEAPLPPSSLAELDAFIARPLHEMSEALPSALSDAAARGGRRGARLIEAMRFLTMESSLLSDLRRATNIPDEALASLRVPTLCAYGTRSSCLPVGERLARVIPGARLSLLEGGHFLPTEAPRALSDAIVEFVDG
jgi:pimeloyl-ACP methyl ester carboxylesterase